MSVYFRIPAQRNGIMIRDIMGERAKAMGVHDYTVYSFIRRIGISGGMGSFSPGGFEDTGKTGEILVRGPSVFKGYWNLEEDTAYTFRYGWHHTGDLGAFDEDGYLWYKGRTDAKELIKSGRENVYPAEVEKAISVHPAIANAVVLGVADDRWGERVEAVCEVKEGESISESELTDFLLTRIAGYKRPKRFIFVEGLPKNEDGSVDRQKVKSQHSSGGVL